MTVKRHESCMPVGPMPGEEMLVIVRLPEDLGRAQGIVDDLEQCGHRFVRHPNTGATVYPHYNVEREFTGLVATLTVLTDSYWKRVADMGIEVIA